MTVHGVFTSNAGDLYEGGELVMTGEFHPLNGLTVDGTIISCTCYSPQGADRVVSFESGGLVCTSTGFDGFYQNTGVYINVPAGSTATFTMPVAAASVYTAYFSNGKFRYDGNTISADDFADLFTVEEVDATHTLFKLSNAAPAFAFGAPSAANVTESSGTVSATLRKIGEGDGTVVVAYATNAEAIDLEHGEFLGAAGPEGAVFSKTISGLTAEVDVFYAFAVIVGGEVVAQTAVASFQPSAYTAKFLGTVSTAANVAANWRDGAVLAFEKFRDAARAERATDVRGCVAHDACKQVDIAHGVAFDDVFEHDAAVQVCEVLERSGLVVDVRKERHAAVREVAAPAGFA